MCSRLISVLPHKTDEMTATDILDDNRTWTFISKRHSIGKQVLCVKEEFTTTESLENIDTKNLKLTLKALFV
jgi:hypothetical protein